MDSKVVASGDTSICAGRWATVTVALPVALPDVAVTAALPFCTAVTMPAASMVATETSSLDQLTLAPAIDCPF